MGADDGMAVGAPDGMAVGELEGMEVGALDGAKLGDSVCESSSRLPVTVLGCAYVGASCSLSASHDRLHSEPSSTRS